MKYSFILLLPLLFAFVEWKRGPFTIKIYSRCYDNEQVKIAVEGLSWEVRPKGGIDSLTVVLEWWLNDADCEKHYCVDYNSDGIINFKDYAECLKGGEK